MQLLLSLLLLLLLSCSVPLTRGHNITTMLSDDKFSTFNHYLTITHLAAEINRRQTITVLAVDNAGMSALLAKHLSLPALKNVLALHVLVDYYGAKKLHQLTGGSALSSSMFQATGSAPGTTGFVNISNHRAGRVTFSAEDAGPDAAPVTFVKSVKEMPYYISVIQISSVLSSPEAEAPTPAPVPVNLTAVMDKKGCKLFSDLLLANKDVENTFETNMDGGLTVFCPVDSAVKAFMPKYKNLTGDGKISLLLYHGVAVYNSMQMLKSNNGAVNTLATDETAKNFHFTVQNAGEVVKLISRVNTATITTTAIDQDPVAVYCVDQVLEPKELFKKAAEAPVPAPAPAPKKAPKGKKIASPPAPEGPNASPADQKAADENAAGRVSGGRWISAAAAMVVAVVAVVV